MTRDLFDAALAPTVRTLCDLRLGLAAVLALLMHSHLAATGAAALVLTVPLNWLPLRSWGRVSAPLTSGWRFPVADVVVTTALASAALTRTGTATLGLSYLLVSALMMGLMVAPVWAWTWCLLTGAGALVTARGAPASVVPSLTWWLPPALGTLAVAGLRLRHRVAEVGLLSRSLAEARSRELAAEERLTIARDLHDTVAKSVMGIRLLSESLVTGLEEDDGTAPNDRALARTLLESADQASREARMVLDELRVPAGADLLTALEDQAHTWSERTGIPCRTRRDAGTVEMGPDARWHVQRVVGELLTNVERHARASSVEVGIGLRDGVLTVSVEDDGQGLPADACAAPRSGHYGLLGVRQRAAKVGGTFHVGSGHGGRGTRAAVIVPVAPGVVESHAA